MYEIDGKYVEIARFHYSHKVGLVWFSKGDKITYWSVEGLRLFKLLFW